MALSKAAEDPNFLGFFNSSLPVKEASEPTDIIWENRQFTRFDYIKRQLGAFIIVGILVLASAILIYKISLQSSVMQAVFPPQNCEGIETTYGDELQHFANKDFEFVTNPQTAGEQSSGCL